MTDLTAEEIEKRSEFMWDWGGAYPLPRFTPQCACNDGRHLPPEYPWHTEVRFLVRSWFFRTQPGNHRCPYRCDITIKCQWCGLVLPFGVVVPVWWWERWQPEERLVRWNDPAALSPNGGPVAAG